MLLSQINYHLKQLQDQCTVKRDPAAFPAPMPPIVDRSKSIVSKPLTKLQEAKARKALRDAAPPLKLVTLPNKIKAMEHKPKVELYVDVLPEDVVEESPAAVLNSLPEALFNSLPVELLESALELDQEPEPEPEPEPALIKLNDSGIYELSEIVQQPLDLLKIFEQYAPKAKGEKMSFKTMGLPVPTKLHERMSKFLAENKDKPGAPQSLRDLGLMCLGFAMDGLEETKTH